MLRMPWPCQGCCGRAKAGSAVAATGSSTQTQSPAQLISAPGTPRTPQAAPAPGRNRLCREIRGKITGRGKQILPWGWGAARLPLRIIPVCVALEMIPLALCSPDLICSRAAGAASGEQQQEHFVFSCPSRAGLCPGFLTWVVEGPGLGLAELSGQRDLCLFRHSLSQVCP